MPIAGVCPKFVSEYYVIVEDVDDVLYRVGSTESTILLRDFNAHFRTDNKTWKGVIGRHGDQAFNETAGIYCSFVVATGSEL